MTQVLERAPAAQKLKVAGVRFHKVGKLYHFDTREYPALKLGDYVVVETVRGRQMGAVEGFAEMEAEREYKPILRTATPRDLVLRQYWEGEQDAALDLCRNKARAMHEDRGIKFVAAVYNYDGSLLTFLYTTEEKGGGGIGGIQEKERLPEKAALSKTWAELNRHLSAQIEMRQIGPRDVAKLLGGFGACGIERCCSTFLTDFSPVSIKMAKAQGISLNPTEITGVCGRLRCCLVYEYDQYVEARAKLPKKNKRVGTPLGEGKVIDVIPLSEAVVVYIEGEGVKTFKKADLTPLEELEALAKKAKEPCNKHGDEPCECGAKPGKPKTAEAKAAAAGEGEAGQAKREADTPTLADAPNANAQPSREMREQMENATETSAAHTVVSPGIEQESNTPEHIADDLNAPKTMGNADATLNAGTSGEAGGGA